MSIHILEPPCIVIMYLGYMHDVDAMSGCQGTNQEYLLFFIYFPVFFLLSGECLEPGRLTLSKFGYFKIRSHVVAEKRS